MRKLIALFCVAILFVGLLGVCLPVSISAESLYIRKIVSVVYDDSGSMGGAKWAYANYAMQAFCGMLNSEDQLFITYMSQTLKTNNYEPKQMDLSADGIQDSVDSIVNHRESGSTPYEAVEIAYNKLRSVNDTNPNTQYWLVVITDGTFNSQETVKDLNNNFLQYAGSTMPNGSNPQITFLAIGPDTVSPDSNENKGIYAYSSEGATEIVDVMSQMADRISGRTRLDKGDIKQIDDRTIQVSSSIPLLNIAVFSQGTDAVITEAVYSNETEIPISRSVSLGYPNYDELVGAAFLVGDSQSVIGSGTYNIRFDKKVSLDDIVVLFEPALEMRMTILLNGKEVTNHFDLQNASEGDKISVSCKIYEMGTDTEISPDLMPPNTKFEVSISEDGKIVKQSSDKDMSLDEYVLSNIETEITAAVLIDGFNPIDYSARFTPTEYVPKIVYTMTADFGSDTHSVKFDNIASNRDLCIEFSVYADGQLMTDPDAVKALKPKIEASPNGNDGTVTYSDDGKIVFTPDSARMSSTNDGSFDVDVTCTIEDGTSATATYTVLISDYQVIPIGTADTIKKTGFFGNQVSVSFYIIKDGVKLDKSAVEKQISVALNEEHSELLTNVVIAEDGTITVTPYSVEEHALTFWNWWVNWWYYFGLEGADLNVTLSHSFGTASANISVTEETLIYQILCVYLPLALELAFLAFMITWVIFIIKKPKFAPNAVLYTGNIFYNSDNYTHIIRNVSCTELKQFNSFKYIWKFTMKPESIDVEGRVTIRADYDGRIICEESFPWYKGTVMPEDPFSVNISKPKDIVTYLQRNRLGLEIREFATTECIKAETSRTIYQNSPRRACYYVIPSGRGKDEKGLSIVDDKKVIATGKIFCYTTESN